MPLTTSHAAAAWPLSRIFPRLPLAAIVLGAMAPDIGYILRIPGLEDTWHVPPNLFLAAVPVALGLWLVWRLYVRDSMVEVLPPRIASDWSLPRLRASSVGAAAVAATLGACTHAIWDGFTKRSGWAVELFPALRRPVAVIPDVWVLPVHRVIQHCSTVAGAVILLIWIVRWWRSYPAVARQFAPGQLARIRMAAFIVFGIAVAGAAVGVFPWEWDLSHILRHFAVGAMLGGAAGLLVWATVYRLGTGGEAQAG